MNKHRFAPLLAAIALAIAVAVPGSGVAQDATPSQLPSDPGCIPNETDGSCLPLAPESDRIDLAMPVFSDPTNITNPLFPIGELHSVLMMGTVDDLPFRVEVTLLPETKVIEWNGQRIETLASQYHAYLDGRILEVAIDWYAQADDGSVWYFGEDVFNYGDGVVADTHGTWRAGKDGPPGMIMPADPQVGDVYRPENIPGNVFEEVTVQQVGVTVDGPLGPVENGIVVRELHQDGAYEDKTFAPGYGEFFTGGDGDIEAVALAVPHDADDGAVPAELDALTNGATSILKDASIDDWQTASSTLTSMTAAWDAYLGGTVPTMIETRMNDSLEALGSGVSASDPEATRQAAISVAQTSLDLQLRYLPPVDVDTARFALWTRQIETDVAATDPAGVTGDVATLEWIWDRIAHTVPDDTASQVNAQIDELRTVAGSGDLNAANDLAAELRGLLTGT